MMHNHSFSRCKCALSTILLNNKTIFLFNLAKCHLILAQYLKAISLFRCWQEKSNRSGMWELQALLIKEKEKEIFNG